MLALSSKPGFKTAVRCLQNWPSYSWLWTNLSLRNSFCFSCVIYLLMSPQIHTSLLGQPTNRLSLCSLEKNIKHKMTFIRYFFIDKIDLLLEWWVFLFIVDAYAREHNQKIPYWLFWSNLVLVMVVVDLQLSRGGLLTGPGNYHTDIRCSRRWS